MRHARLLPLLLSSLLVGGCASHRPVTVATEPPPLALPAAAPLPAGASPGMMVPQPLADGSFPTPNRGLSAAAALWHLRAGLNVAALSCPGAEGETIRAGYNGWLGQRKKVLAGAATAYAAEWHVATPAGRVAYDEAMTRLYNFWSQTPARPAFCSAAAAMIGEVAAADPASLPALAEARLPVLDAAFVDFYRAYDAWRRGAAIQPVIAVAAVTPPGPAAATSPRAGGRPRLELDLSTLPIDTTTIASR